MQKPSQFHYFVLSKMWDIFDEKDCMFIEDTYRHAAEFYGITTEEVSQMIEEVEAYEEAMAELEYNR